MSTECTHTLASGAKCQAPARTGSTFCHHHNPRTHLDPHPRETPESEPLMLPPLLDKCAILVAVTEIVHAASERRIKCSEARTLLMALQFASRLMTEIDTEGLSSSTRLDSQHREPSHEAPSPRSADSARQNGSVLTPDELDEFTQRLQKSAVQQLRRQSEGIVRKRVAGMADNDRALASLVASTDPRTEHRPSGL
jgi:hypothetical protein